MCFVVFHQLMDLLSCVNNVSAFKLPILSHFLSAAKDKGEKKLFGFAFTPLMREDGTTLSDESHELYVYKVRQKC